MSEAIATTYRSSASQLMAGKKVLPVDEEFVGGVDHFISSIFNLGVGRMKLFLLWLSATMSYVSVSSRQ
jgi:hypothetical protein